MPGVRIARRRRWAPGPTAQIDRSHPLAAGLAFCIAGGQIDVVSNARARLQANGSYGAMAFGPGLRSASSSTGGALYTSSIPGVVGSTAMTVAAVASLSSLGGTFSHLVCAPYDASGSWSAPYATFAFSRVSGRTNPALQYAVSAAAIAQNEATSSGYWATDGPHLYAAVRSGTAIDYWKDQAIAVSLAGVNPSAFSRGSGAEVGVMQRSSTTPDESMQGVVSFAAIWARALSANELAMVYADPFCMFRT